MTRFRYGLACASAVLMAAPGLDARADPPVTLYTFPHIADGIVPFAPVILLPSGALVGTTGAGGDGGCSALESPPGCGTVFALLPGPAKGQWTEVVLHKFRPATGDGARPSAPVVADASGNLFGTTANGGVCARRKRGCGIVFELSPPAPGHSVWTETVIHDFAGRPDGENPQAGLVLDAAGNLYGTTASGGAHGSGTVFQLTPGQGGSYTETVLASLDGSKGQSYAPVLIGASRVLYGTTEGVAGQTAEVFSLTPPKSGTTRWTMASLYDFPASNPLNVVAGLSADAAGNLYGTNGYGGNFKGCRGDQMYGCGLVFKLAPPANGATAWTETDLHVFTGSQTDGAAPFGGVLAGGDGTLTGTTLGGGGEAGTVFQLKPMKDGSYASRIVARFRGPHRGGLNPATALAVDAAGVFYGTTDESIGSAFPPYGTVYSVEP